MPEPIALRGGGPADYDHVMRIWREASRIGHPFLSEADLDAQEAMTRKEHLPLADLVLAEQGDEVVGFIATLGSHVGALFVAPRAQGQGIGRLLIEEAQRCKSALTLDVYEANAGALAFYVRLGFTEVSRRGRDSQGRPLSELTLEWRRGTGASSDGGSSGPRI